MFSTAFGLRLAQFHATTHPMTPPSSFHRDRLENWVSDFCLSDRLREAPSNTHEHAVAVLVEFLVAACEHRGVEPADIEEEDLKHALLTRLARVNVPAEAKRDLPILCAAFLAHLQDEGRLSDGRLLGAYVRALRESWDEACSGKRKPITRAGSKIGRNDPCPCGSGRKYKSCCLKG
jgi:uncharacterized protein YchJ